MKNKIALFFDNNVFNLFYKYKINLIKEFLPDDYCLWIAREVEFEIKPIKDEYIKNYIQNLIKECDIKTFSYFGFFDDRFSSEEQRVGGFGFGHFIDKTEIEYYQKYKHKIGEIIKPKSRLFPNEADCMMAAKSHMPDSYIITMDCKKNDPLYLALKDGGKVIAFKEGTEQDDFNSSLESFGEFIKRRITFLIN